MSFRRRRDKRSISSVNKVANNLRLNTSRCSQPRHSRNTSTSLAKRDRPWLRVVQKLVDSTRAQSGRPAIARRTFVKRPFRKGAALLHERQ
jgi:hypothetical protein